MNYKVMLVIYYILSVISYLYDVFYNQDAAAVRIGGADLVVCCVIQ